MEMEDEFNSHIHILGSTQSGKSEFIKIMFRKLNIKS